MSDIPSAVWTNAAQKLDEARTGVACSSFPIPGSVKAALDTLDLLIQINESD